MSWHFKKAGTLRDALKAAVQAESGAPQSIRDEVCKRIDECYCTPGAKSGASVPGNVVPAGSVILVESYGHFDEDDGTTEARPFRNLDTMQIRVNQIPLIDTPLSPEAAL